MTDMQTGRFVWHELMTTDTSAAIAFYGHVVGWKTQAFGEGSDPYPMWVAGQGPLGGVMKLPEDMRKMGAPPHWLSHVEVADVDAAVAEARRLDAHVLVPPTDIPTVGRFSIIADPQGAAISVFKPAQPMAAHDGEKPGEFCWSELVTTNSEVAFQFYSKVFGWKKTGEHDMGPMGKYLLFGPGDKAVGGMMTKPADSPNPSAWLYYVTVEDLDAALERAKSKGASVLYGPMEIPGGSRVSALLDPQGAAFALLGPGKK